ncbi:MAG: SH3 domain-containing protein [Candidatus Omnitrophica bacterium]|nr:SH3 domain-containing protein [Candidatus Omnitrophota bacterium]
MLKKFFLILSLLCFGSHIADAQEAFPFVAKVKAKSANVRAGQNANFESLGQVQEGAEVVVVGASFDWRKIKLPADAKAYVNAGFVKDLGDGVGEVTGNRLNIRAGALVNAAIIGQLKKGDLIRLVEKKNDWYRIEPPDQSFGWVLNEFLEKTSQDIPSPRVVQAPIKNIYVKKRLEAGKADELPPGVVRISGTVEDLANNMVSSNIRHYVQSDGTVYALQGYRHVIDSFLHQKVKIEGRIKPDVKSDKPVLLVTKISLVL